MIVPACLCCLKYLPLPPDRVLLPWLDLLHCWNVVVGGQTKMGTLCRARDARGRGASSTSRASDTPTNRVNGPAVRLLNPQAYLQQEKGMHEHMGNDFRQVYWACCLGFHYTPYSIATS